jgi:hypothetical protein
MRWIFLALLAVGCKAQDPGLANLRATLVPMRKEVQSEIRGATPRLTFAKHQLRDWMESKLAALPQVGDAGALERTLNRELTDFGLFCEVGSETPCPEWFFTGYIGRVRLSRNGAFLIAITGAGIECGFDQSAYVYSWSGEKWMRVHQFEQNVYEKGKYFPKTIKSVQISPSNGQKDHLLLTLGYESWCSSAWHKVYYRVDRLGPDWQARPLVERQELAWNPELIEGTIGPTDALVEFPIGAIDVGVHHRPAVRHYAILGDSVQRIDPVALRPSDFVDEWLTHDWSEAQEWSESKHRGAMQDRHRVFDTGHFLFPTTHCAATPDLWQVGIDLSNPPTPWDKPPNGTYFLVRWRPHYKFSMVDVSAQPFPGCTEKDPSADDEPRTLFPGKRD